MFVQNVNKLGLLFVISLFFLSTSYSQQAGYTPVWDKHYGGSKDEIIAVLLESANNGFLLAGTSFSGQSFDLTEPNRDSTLQSSDFWIIRTDSAGNKLWDKRFGGSGSETLLHAITVSGGGYLLAGISFSGNTGDKSQPNHDPSLLTPDIWVVRTDSSGNKLWDARFGGSASEQLGEITEISQDSYLIAGSTYSPDDGDISEPTKGEWDYWYVIVDDSGNIQSDKRFGGTSDDFCTAVLVTHEKSIILGGYTRSGSGGDKTQASQGGADYWIITADSAGNKLWDKAFGGAQNDWLFDLAMTAGNDLILGGQSFSGATGDKSDPNHDPGPNGSDRWIIRTDSSGVKIWDKTYGADQTEDVNNIEILPDGNIMICGESYSSQNGDKTEPNLGPEQTWILVTDSTGTIIWDKTLFTFSHDEKGYTIMKENNCFVTVNYTRADSSGYKTEDNYGEGDYWMIKMCPDSLSSVNESQITDIDISVIPNPASESCFIQIRGSGFTPDQLIVYSISGEMVHRRDIQFSKAVEIKLETSHIPSGLYILELKNQEHRFYSKLVISR